jgi:hypothetical protein
MRHRLAHIVRLFACSTFAIAAFLASGCGCTERVTVRNDTAQPVRMELALPWPAYEVVASPCRFRETIAPGASWSSGDAAGDPTVPLRQPNGRTVVRFAIDDGSLLTAPDWREYSVSHDQPVTLVLREDAAGEHPTLHLAGPTEAEIHPSGDRWFD